MADPCLNFSRFSTFLERENPAGVASACFGEVPPVRALFDPCPRRTYRKLKIGGQIPSLQKLEGWYGTLGVLGSSFVKSEPQAHTGWIWTGSS